VTDGVLIGKLADMNLVVFRQGKSQKHQIREVNQVAENRIMPNLLLVFNDFRSNKNGYGYGKGGYGYYSDNSKSKDDKEFENVLVKTV
jgi:hypothetical protein